MTIGSPFMRLLVSALLLIAALLATGSDRVLVARGFADPEHARIDIDTIHLGRVPVGRCHDTTLLIHRRLPGFKFRFSGAFVTGSNPQYFSATLPSPITVGDVSASRIRFCPTVDVFVSATIVYTWVFESSSQFGVEADSVVVIANAGTPALVASVDELDFGEVDSGRCRRDSFFVRNVADSVVLLTASTLRSFGSFGTFSLRSTGRLPRPLAPGESLAIVVDYCPRHVGEDEGEWRGYGSDSLPFGVRLKGIGVAPAMTIDPEGIFFDCVPLGSRPSRPVTVRNTGRADLSIIRFRLGNGSRFLVSSSSITLRPGESHSEEITFDAGITPGTYDDELTIETSLGSRTIPLHGVTAPEPALTTLEPSHDFGDVRLQSEEPHCIAVANSSCRALVVRGIEFDREEFALRDAIPLPFVVESGASICVVARPTRLGPVAGTMRIHHDNGVLEIALSAHGVWGDGHMLWLDTLTATVGDRASMGLHLYPPPTPQQSATGARIYLRVDPLAIYPHGVVAFGQTTIAPRLIDRRNGIIEIEIPRLPYIDEGDEIMELRLEGLFSGRTVNEVVIDSVRFDGIGDVRFIGNGVFYLNGCDPGSGLAIAKSVSIHSISPNPAIDDARLDFSAPAGTLPRLRLVDALGRHALDIELRSGDGRRVESIDLGSVAHGFYVVQLVAGEMVSTRTLIIGE